MAKQKFEDKKLTGSIKITMKERGEVWQGDKAVVISQCLNVIDEYSTRLTLRQLYYQLVSREWIPNHDRVYKKLGNILRDARMAGVIDWNSIEDRVRVPYIGSDWETPEKAIVSLYHSYRINRSRTQDVHVELWCEKDAISSILKPITEYYHVHLMVNRGYSSVSAIYAAYLRMWQKIKSGKKVVILYLGDHDPSGLDMVRDIRERLMMMFSEKEEFYESGIFNRFIDKNGFLNDYGSEILDDYTYKNGYEDFDNSWGFNFPKAFAADNFKVEQIGLTMEQIKQLKPPPNPAKITDSRAKNYIDEFGPVSWEVDAIPPDRLNDIVTDKIRENLDLEKWEQEYQIEQADKKVLLERFNLSDDDVK